MNLANDWREDAGTWKENILNYILTNENTQKDVVIVAGSGSTEIKIKAHSLVLFIGSQVLATLLEEAKINNDGMKEIKLPDVRPETVKFVLKYIYTNGFHAQNEDILDILYASLKLNLRGLEAFCVAKLKNELSAENVLRIFEQSEKLKIEELVEKSKQFIFKNAGEVFRHETFLNITNETLCKLLAFSELDMNEISIFNSIVSWAKAECVRLELEENSTNLRFVLKTIVPLIRFTLMSTHEFTSLVVPTNILDDKKVIDVYIYLGMKTSNTGKQVEPPLWISSSSERKIVIESEIASSTNAKYSGVKQTENGESHHGEIQPKNIKIIRHNLLQYLKNVPGKHTILGINHQSSESINTVRNLTGIHPGILTLTLPSHLEEIAPWQSFTEEMISKWNNGYLLRIAFRDSDHPLEQLEILEIFDDHWNDLTNDNGHLNQEWKKQLDAIVPYFQKLQDAGVVVIFDLFPRIISTSLSWGGRPGKKGSVKLYQLTHDYITQKHQLHSLLWTWSFYTFSGTKNLKEFWPGNEYVDVVSVYLYTNKHLEMNVYQKLLEFVGDKPFSMESLWTIPKSSVFSQQPRWTWFTPITIDANMKTKIQNLSIIDKENNEFFKTLTSIPLVANK